MHKSALQTGQIFFETYWCNEFHNILDIGSRDVNGSLRSVKPVNGAYLGVDVTAGPGVELVLKDPHHLPFDDESFDVIVSTSCLEHDPMFWLSVAEMFRVVRPGGYVYINAPSNGNYHGYPFDHWRFYPDAGQALVQWAERLERPVQLVESFIGRKVEDVWADNVMVFARVPHDRKFPDKLVCDQITGATNVRRHDSDTLVKREIAPEDLRELKQSQKEYSELKQNFEAARLQVTELIQHKIRLEQEIEEMAVTTALPSIEATATSGASKQISDPYETTYKTAFDLDFLKGYQAGTMAYTYKGIPCLKNPIDLAIYSKAIWDFKPATIIELGSNAGGSALWFADTLECFDNPARVVSIDLNVPTTVKHDRITFLQGDVTKLASILQDHGLRDLPRPWFVIEDSAHTYDTCLEVLKQLSTILQSGDMLVMEDGILDDLGLTDKYRGGPNRALHEWFAEQPDVFTVDRTLCDMFGRNATYAPNAWLRKV